MKAFLHSAVLSTIICVSALVSCRRSEDSSIKKPTAEEKKIAALVKAKAEEHNAVDVLLGRSANRYTVQAQKALMPSDGRPVLVFATVRDIRIRDGKYSIDFRDSFVSGPLVFSHDVECLYTLECSLDQVEAIIERQKTGYQEDNPLSSLWTNEYAVIARFCSVEKPRFFVRAEPTSEYEAEVIIESANVIIATGRCVDLVFLGNYGLGKSDEALRLLLGTE